MKKTAVLLGFVILLSIYPLSLHPSPGHAEDLFQEFSTDNVLFLRGIISKVYSEEMQIAVRPLKEKRIIITIGPDTLLEGISKLDELEKKQQVKVWYSIENDDNKALKIMKIMELGC